MTFFNVYALNFCQIKCRMLKSFGFNIGMKMQLCNFLEDGIFTVIYKIGYG